MAELAVRSGEAMSSSIFQCAVLYLLLRLLPLGFASTPDNNVEVDFMNGQQLFGGDIVLSQEQANALLGEEPSLSSSSTSSSASSASSSSSGQQRVQHKRAVVTVTSKRWPRGVMPYTISQTLNDSVRDVILASMQQIQRDTNFCVNFKPAQTNDKDYVHFFRGDGCYSSVGRRGGKQDISIGTYCDTNGLIMHEILHALGRWHEQSRPDRDSYITINTNNIRDGFQDNFKMIEGGDSSTQDLGYDFDSLMHYDAFAFSANDQPTITPVDHTVPLTRLGQRTVLSATDVRHIKALYCPEEKGEWSSWSSWSSCSSRPCGTGTRSRTRMCLEGSGLSCEGSASEQASCPREGCPTTAAPSLPDAQKWGEWSRWSGCSRSCGKGQRSRIRNCVLAGCMERDIKMEDCNIRPCAEESEWTSWSLWSSCGPSLNHTHQLARSSRHRTRNCRNVVSKAPMADMYCTGVAMETESCVTNLSCMDYVGKAGCQGCPFASCLRGLQHYGCRWIPSDQLKTLQVADTLEWTNASHASSSDGALRLCGKKAKIEGRDFFGLNGSFCVLGRAVSEHALEVCNEETRLVASRTLELYRIADWKEFELSVGAYDSCGPEFCRGFNVTEVVSAASAATHCHLIYSLFSFLLLLLW